MMYWKNIRWSNQDKCYFNPENGLKLIGVNKWFNSKFVEEVDFDEIAQKVADKRGITVGEVKKEWGEKNKRGKSLHNYIDKFIKGKYFKTDNYVIEYREVINRKLNELKEDGWKPFSIEENLSAFGLNGIPDAIFYKVDKDGKANYLIVDWKFVEKFTTYNKYSNLTNELRDIDASHYIKYMCIGQIYKYMFYEQMSKHFPKITLDKIDILVVNFKNGESHKDYYLDALTELETSEKLIKKLREYETSEEREKISNYEE